MGTVYSGLHGMSSASQGQSLSRDKPVGAKHLHAITYNNVIA